MEDRTCSMHSLAHRQGEGRVATLLVIGMVSQGTGHTGVQEVFVSNSRYRMLQRRMNVAQNK